MIVSEKHKFICIQIPHTGSTSMAMWCRRFFGGRKIETKHEWRVPDEYKDYFKFALVRNPYDRMFTWWWFSKERDGYAGSFISFVRMIKKQSDEGLAGATKNPALKVPEFFMPQSKRVDIAGIDLTLKLESVPKTLKQLPFINNGYVPPFPHKNKTGTKPATPPKDYFNPTELAAVREYEDFKAIGYEI